MWVVDTGRALPTLLLALLLFGFMGPGGVATLVLIVSLILAPKLARAARDEVAGYRSGRYNARTGWFNSFTSMLTLSLGLAILMEATLSFLGVGLQPPVPSWGNMVAAGQLEAWWTFFPPGLVLAIVVTLLIVSPFRWWKIWR